MKHLTLNLLNKLSETFKSMIKTKVLLYQRTFGDSINKDQTAFSVQSDIGLYYPEKVL